MSTRAIVRISLILDVFRFVQNIFKIKNINTIHLSLVLTSIPFLSSLALAGTIYQTFSRKSYDSLLWICRSEESTLLGPLKAKNYYFYLFLFYTIFLLFWEKIKHLVNHIFFVYLVKGIAFERVLLGVDTLQTLSDVIPTSPNTPSSPISSASPLKGSITRSMTKKIQKRLPLDDHKFNGFLILFRWAKEITKTWRRACKSSSVDLNWAIVWALLSIMLKT